jgi:hypothetical protein
MRRYLRVLGLTGLLVVCVGVAAFATPTVSLKSFDTGTFTYTYEVTLHAGDLFSQLAISTKGLEEPFSGPYWQYASAPSGWSGSTTFGPPDGAQWTGSLINTPGVYDFSWTVRNSRPTDVAVADSVETWAGVESYGSQAVRVPTAVPEPSSFVVFGFYAGAVLSALRRKIR